MTASQDFFPDHERVIYDTSPVFEVLFQVRFHPILKIEASVPADFQEAIRSKFPAFERSQSEGIPNVPPDVAKILGLAAQGGAEYRFKSEDGRQTVGLNTSSLSLTSTKYHRWEEFRDLLAPTLSALEKFYRPGSFTRVGLRYRNAIVPSAISLEDKSWAALLSPNVGGELKYQDFGPADTLEAARQLRLLSRQDQTGVFLQHGIGRVENTNAPAYIIDIDCYTDQRTEADHVLKSLDTFNVRARRAFRWCISDALHKALGPKRVKDDLVA